MTALHDRTARCAAPALERRTRQLLTRSLLRQAKLLTAQGKHVTILTPGPAGRITVRGYVSIPTDQAWFFTPEWLAGEREADDEITAGRGTAHESAEDMFAHLDGFGAADA
jgi:antitoxin PrlF